MFGKNRSFLATRNLEERIIGLEILIIRQSNKSDLYRIRNVVSLAFNPVGSSTGTKVVEADLVEELITDKDDTINLVAECSEIIGHVLASPVTISSSCSLRGAQVAPLSVLPSHQSQGVGSSLMQSVIETSHDLNLDVLFLLGDLLYYRRFGFVKSDVVSAYGISPYYQELLLTACSSELIGSSVRLAPAFLKLGL